jgi:hypothetical protein
VSEVDATPSRRSPPPRYATRDELEARIEQKRDRVLRWLADEQFTTAKVLEQVLELQWNAVRKTVASMVRDNLVDLQEVHWNDFKLRLIVLTAHGAALVDPQSESYQQGRVASSSIAHSIDVQRARLLFEKAGWSAWTSERRLREEAAREVRAGVRVGDRAWPKVPDAVGTSAKGHRVAVEMERTIKTSKTYELIAGQYAAMFDRGVVNQVQYVVTSRKVRDALKAKFAALQTVAVPIGEKQNGATAFERRTFDEDDRVRFHFSAMEDLAAKATAETPTAEAESEGA